MTAINSQLNLNSIGQIAVSVSDIDRATEFYRDKLGMRFLFSAPPSMSFFDCDGVRLMLTVPERGDDEPNGSAVVHFPVAEIRPAEVHSRRIAHGNALYFTVPDVRQATEIAQVARRPLLRRAARYPPHRHLRPLDVILHRPRRQHPRPHGGSSPITPVL